MVEGESSVLLPTCDVIVKHFVSFACSRASLSVVGVIGLFAALCKVSETTFVASCVKFTPPIVPMKRTAVSLPLRVRDAKS